MALELVVSALATWRIASLLATEQGPWDMFGKIRATLGVYYHAEGSLMPYADNVFGKAVICVWCSSVWIALLFVIGGRIAPKPTFLVALPLAISAGAVIINGVIEWLEQAQQRS